MVLAPRHTHPQNRLKRNSIKQGGKMLRSILAVIAGSALWTVLWIGSNAILAAVLPPRASPNKIESVPVLLLILVLSVIFSILAGYVTAQLARRKEMAHTLVLGVLQLAMGIAAQLANFDALPLWYHIGFLLLLIPGNLLGGVLQTKKREASFA
jgi:hypothetical protein